MNEDVRHALFASIVQNTNDLITVFDTNGVMVFMNDACRQVLGGEAEQFVGRNIIDFVHPDEVERAIKTLTLSREFGAPPGNTHFRIRRSDGSFVALELTSGPVSDGQRQMLMTSGRRADTRFALELALQQLLGGGQLADVMTTVCDTFSWKPLNSRVAFTWQASDGSEQRVTTGGLPESLAGAGASPDSPWAVARATMRGVEELTLDKLPSNLRALAEQHNLGAYWVEPVRAGTVPALITVWTARGGRPPAIHVQGMMLARSIVEIIMRWTDQQARLDFAAFHDELTSLPNRKAFFRALERSVPGAILYCDLDRFKPVNDSFGHAAGDELLRQVARRLQATVRSDDLVARLGGDEFVILCPASTAADAEQLADRIRAAIAEPFSIHSADVSIGISVGIAHTNDRLDDSSVAAADRALYSAKALRRAARD